MNAISIFMYQKIPPKKIKLKKIKCLDVHGGTSSVSSCINRFYKYIRLLKLTLWYGKKSLHIIAISKKISLFTNYLGGNLKL